MSQTLKSLTGRYNLWLNAKTVDYVSVFLTKYFLLMKNNLFTININLPYLETLAQGIYERFDNGIRPYVLLLLPSQRAVLNFQNVFIKNHQNTTLPKVESISYYFNRSSLVDCQNNTLSRLQAFDFILKALKKYTSLESYDHLKTLALEIISLYDEITLSGSTKIELLKILDSKKQGSQEEFLLKNITRDYLDFLKTNQFIDEKEDLYHKALLSIHVLEEQNTLNHPIILGGTTGTIPFVQKFAKILLKSEHGYIVLPGYSNTQENISIHHPFYTQSEWVKNISLTENIKPFIHKKPLVDLECIFEDEIQENPIEINHIIPFNMDSFFHEAFLISILVRHHLEENKQISIVCNDPILCKYIQDALNKYGFSANSSLRESLKNSVPGKFLNLFIKTLQTKNLESMISLLKHPFYGAKKRMIHLKTLDSFEKKLLINNITSLEQCFRIFGELDVLKKYNSQKYDQNDWLTLMIKDLIFLSDEVVFSKSDGIALKAFLESLSIIFDKEKKVSFVEFINLFSHLLDLAPPIIDYSNLHQNVTLIGTIEARHHAADVIILAGLNEGQWPTSSKPNIWLTLEDQKKLNLASHERKLGLSAHDFASCLNAKTVYLTRSLRIDGIPTKENRWLKRLMINTKLTEEAIDKKKWFLSILQNLYKDKVSKTESQTLTLPLPFPKPRKLSISALELLNNDDVAYFNKYVLGLRERAKWYKPLDASHIGQIVHKILEKIDFGDAHSFEFVIDEALKGLILPYHQTFFLKKHIKEMLLFIAEDYLNTLPTSIMREKKISFELFDIIFFGIADRIDFKNDIPIRLIDYKTGIPATFSDIVKGKSLQMPLLLKMCAENFPSNHQPLAQYFSLKGYKDQSKIITLPINDDIMKKTFSYVEKMVNYYFG
jgi:ATP-dependent helicase/nuclease subunit B